MIDLKIAELSCYSSVNSNVTATFRASIAETKTMHRKDKKTLDSVGKVDMLRSMTLGVDESLNNSMAMGIQEKQTSNLRCSTYRLMRCTTRHATRVSATRRDTE